MINGECKMVNVKCKSVEIGKSEREEKSGRSMVGYLLMVTGKWLGPGGNAAGSFSAVSVTGITTSQQVQNGITRLCDRLGFRIHRILDRLVLRQ